MEGKVKVLIKNGLHARPAAEFVKLAAGFKSCSVNILKNSKKADSKSILGVMSSSVSEGDEITLLVEGEGEKEAFDALKNFLEEKSGERRFCGTPIFTGNAAGKLRVRRGMNMELKNPAPDEIDVAAETKAFDNALERCNVMLADLASEALSKLGAENAALFDAHAMIASAFAPAVRENIAGGRCASDALIVTVRQWRENIAGMNEFMRERAADIEDVGKRIFALLNGIGEDSVSSGEPHILAAKELAPSEVAQADKNVVIGIITQEGGATSHFAILTGALGIPAISGIDFAKLSEFDGANVIIDNECLIVSPSEASIKEHERKIELFKTIDKSAMQRDSLLIFGNISKGEEAAAVLENGGAGIGLFRTEFLFMNRNTPPSEDEQYAEYTKALEIMDGKPVVIRTLDCGGDKDIPYLNPAVPEKNPFLGVRGIRICLNEKELFITQLRALLRASTAGDLRILIPMITCLNDVIETKKLLEEAKRRLTDEKIVFNPQVKFGIMIEVPAAAIEAEKLAREVDFFSVGSNDLVQYTLAADRTNRNVARWSDDFNPAVLRLMKSVNEAARNAGIGCGICGEFAGNAAALPLLAALGYTSISMSAVKIPNIKRALCGISVESAQRTLAEKFE